jgi:hypothetical protein
LSNPVNKFPLTYHIKRIDEDFSVGLKLKKKKTLERQTGKHRVEPGQPNLVTPLQVTPSALAQTNLSVIFHLQEISATDTLCKGSFVDRAASRADQARKSSSEVPSRGEVLTS